MFEQVLEAVTIAVFMATVANRLVEGLVKPVFTKFEWDSFWLMYVAWAMGGVLVWFTGVNLFAPFIPDPVVGQVLSALVAGGGANLINDIFKQPSVTELMAVSEPIDFGDAGRGVG